MAHARQQQLQQGLEDLSQIRSIMERSSKFLSLSGLSGVSAGLCALAGIIAARYRLRLSGPDGPPPSELARALIFDSIAVLSLSIALALFFSRRMAIRKGVPFSGAHGGAMLAALLIPLAAGLAFIAALLFSGVPQLIPAAMLTFYGLALINASHHTHGEIRSLGYCELALGAVAAVWPDFWMYLWAAGFGILHISYGLYMYWKYER